MPTYTMSEGFFEEYEIPFNAEEFTRTPEGEWAAYSPVEDKPLDLRELTATATLAYHALIEKGALEAVCRYDGGYDEGFAYFEAAVWGEQRLDAASLAASLEAGPLGEKPQDTFIYYTPEMEARLTRVDRVKNALEELASCLASQLLGRGFGTGEAGIEGRFHIDLKTGIIKDEVPEGFEPNGFEGA